MAEVFGAVKSAPLIGNGGDDDDFVLLGWSGRGAAAAKAAKAAQDNENQFCLLSFGSDAGAPSLIDPQQATAALAGSEGQPDVRARFELVSLHVENGLNADYPRATLRFDIGKDERSPSRLKPLFWCVAAGLDLAGELVPGLKNHSGAKYRTDFDEVLGRPVEIPGGLAQIRFELAAHKEPPWWKEMFKIFKTRTGETLVSALGFPGIVKEAIDIVDSAFDRLKSEDSQMVCQNPRQYRSALCPRRRASSTGFRVSPTAAALSDRRDRRGVQPPLRRPGASPPITAAACTRS